MMPISFPFSSVFSSGNSYSTSAISFPRSPHPTYTMQFVFAYFDSACEITVFPHPNAPGMQHVPPSTDGNSVSMMRWPVISGWFPGSFSITGRELRTGHKWDIVSLLTTPVVSSRTSSNVSFRVSSSLPSVSPPYTFTTVPFRFGGHMMLCSGISSFSYTTPKISPPEMISPSLKWRGV